MKMATEVANKTLSLEYIAFYILQPPLLSTLMIFFWGLNLNEMKQWIWILPRPIFPLFPSILIECLRLSHIIIVLPFL